MKRPVYLVAACVGALMLAAGCGRSETPAGNPAAPPAKPAQEAPTSASMPSPPPPMPPPDAPKGNVAPDPKPGQVNDHSNPAFKKGGEESPTK